MIQTHSEMFTQLYLVMKTKTLIQAFYFKHTCGNICLVFIYSWVFKYCFRPVILNTGRGNQPYFPIFIGVKTFDLGL